LVSVEMGWDWKNIMETGGNGNYNTVPSHLYTGRVPVYIAL